MDKENNKELKEEIEELKEEIGDIKTVLESINFLQDKNKNYDPDDVRLYDDERDNVVSGEEESREFDKEQFNLTEEEIEQIHKEIDKIFEERKAVDTEFEWQEDKQYNEKEPSFKKFFGLSEDEYEGYKEACDIVASGKKIEDDEEKITNSVDVDINDEEDKSDVAERLDVSDEVVKRMAEEIGYNEDNEEDDEDEKEEIEEHIEEHDKDIKEKHFDYSYYVDTTNLNRYIVVDRDDVNQDWVYLLPKNKEEELEWIDDYNEDDVWKVNVTTRPIYEVPVYIYNIDSHTWDGIKTLYNGGDIEKHRDFDVGYYVLNTDTYDRGIITDMNDDYLYVEYKEDQNVRDNPRIPVSRDNKDNLKLISDYIYYIDNQKWKLIVDVLEKADERVQYVEDHKEKIEEHKDVFNAIADAEKDRSEDVEDDEREDLDQDKLYNNGDKLVNRYNYNRYEVYELNYDDYTLYNKYSGEYEDVDQYNTEEYHIEISDRLYDLDRDTWEDIRDMISCFDMGP